MNRVRTDPASGHTNPERPGRKGVVSQNHPEPASPGPKVWPENEHKCRWLGRRADQPEGAGCLGIKPVGPVLRLRPPGHWPGDFCQPHWVRLRADFRGGG